MIQMYLNDQLYNRICEETTLRFQSKVGTLKVEVFFFCGVQVLIF